MKGNIVNADRQVRQSAPYSQIIVRRVLLVRWALVQMATISSPGVGRRGYEQQFYEAGWSTVLNLLIYPGKT